MTASPLPLSEWRKQSAARRAARKARERGDFQEAARVVLAEDKRQADLTALARREAAIRRLKAERSQLRDENERLRRLAEKFGVKVR